MPTFLFDGDCGFCTSSARWLERNAISAARVVPWQRTNLAALGVSQQDVVASVQWVDGRERSAGPDAIADYLRSSTTGWRALGSVLASPPVRPLARPVYAWVARNRGSMPGGPPALRHDVEAPVKVRGMRRRKSGDLLGLRNLVAVVHERDRYPFYWPESRQAWLYGPDVLAGWVVERAGDVVGHVSIGRVGRTAKEGLHWREVTGQDPRDLAGVSQLLVHPQARGQGIGAALVSRAVAEIRQRGLTPVLDVVTVNTDAIALYERQGWRLLATFPWGEPEDDLEVNFYAAPRSS